jgi:hypothetical protein
VEIGATGPTNAENAEEAAAVEEGTETSGGGQGVDPTTAEPRTGEKAGASVVVRKDISGGTALRTEAGEAQGEEEEETGGEGHPAETADEEEAGTEIPETGQDGTTTEAETTAEGDQTQAPGTTAGGTATTREKTEGGLLEGTAPLGGIHPEETHPDNRPDPLPTTTRTEEATLKAEFDFFSTEFLKH